MYAYYLSDEYDSTYTPRAHNPKPTPQYDIFNDSPDKIMMMEEIERIGPMSTEEMLKKKNAGLSRQINSITASIA